MDNEEPRRGHISTEVGNVLNKQMLPLEHGESAADYAEGRNLSLESLQPNDDDIREKASAEAQHGLAGIESRKDTLDKLSHKLQGILEGFGEDIQRANDHLQQMLYATFTDGLRGLQYKIKALDRLQEAQNSLSSKIRL
ncbi:hypothetical protein NDN08_006505 [Rhodosorus marinus]|uniref:Biogenesis of lysosome-related organelles complex 1 subunit 7 n=1 Tax=Rhodosorus marinus TaxID=101924 RepID=A0AAV8ULI4_9RHOD|nr:hypothetical protein NDN08_006505 [Rhodosorus marinus]